MKKLLSILILVLSLNAYSQVKVSESLNVHLEQFIIDASDRGYFLTGIIVNDFENIVVVDDLRGYANNEFLLGVTLLDYKTILIDSSLLADEKLLKLTLYHELGHALTKSDTHSCDTCFSIMSQFSPSDKGMLDYDDEIYWNKTLDDYFEWLNENYKKA